MLWSFIVGLIHFIIWILFVGFYSRTSYRTCLTRPGKVWIITGIIYAIIIGIYYV